MVEDVVVRSTRGQVKLQVVLPSERAKRDVDAKCNRVKQSYSMVTTLLSRVETNPKLRKRQIS